MNIALVGNPNCGKTTLFNALTGANQYVGNWPGVTVEKKEGKAKLNKEVTITDLPGIYSLSPYSPEELVARSFLVNEAPNVILNILDGTNLERNLYLTTQLAELGIPMVIAINMMDVVRKSGLDIDKDNLCKTLGVEVVEISAVKGQGTTEILEGAIRAYENKTLCKTVKYNSAIEDALVEIADITKSSLRFQLVKLFDRDEETKKQFSQIELGAIENVIAKTEKILDSDSESAVINERYDFITNKVVKGTKIKGESKVSTSDKIDKVLTHRIFALPIFAVIMFLVYFIAMAPNFIGTALTDWANDGVFGDGYFLFGIGQEKYEEALDEYTLNQEILENLPDGYATEDFILEREDEEGNTYTVTVTYEMVKNAMANKDQEEPDVGNFGPYIVGVPTVIGWWLDSAQAPEWLSSLLLDGIIGGVGAVLGFVPQLIILFILLSLLEDCGYMSRVAFILDRLFRRFGLSGKSFIPMLVAVGCGVPGIMASRTIEQERDRRLTIMTTGFIPCSAKMPIVGLVAGALFGGNALIATASYFIGIGAVVVSGIILKKTKLFSGKPAPFVMELPAYHLPVASNVFRTTFERAWSFIKRAGTVIFIASVIIWVLNSLSFEGGFHYITDELGGASILENIGSAISFLFIPLGFGSWQATVATFLGLVAKEEVVGFFGVLGQDVGLEIFAGSQLCAFCFLVFNLLCAPCFGAMGAIKREMNSPKWTAFAIGYMTCFAYLVTLCIYQIGILFRWGHFDFFTVVALLIVAVVIYLLVRPERFSLIDKIKAKIKK
ncbi:MAG: ferrous iron transporter B [Clostridia bacterium]|nr:ferrous iron transporter B [Clostridia bacterium]